MKYTGSIQLSAMRRWRLAAPWLVSALLAACGGGGGGGSSASASLSGVAVDGYLQGASVFLDVNRNGILDAGEPSTTTDANGRYTLEYSSVSSSVKGLPIVVTGGIDSDTGYAFAGRLSAPVDLAASAQVVSPLTSLVDALVAQGAATDAAAARAMVASALGLSAADLLKDPVAAIANQPAIYAQQVALQRAVQMLASANAEPNESAHDAQERVIKALALAIRAQTSAVSVGQLVSGIASGQMKETEAGRKLAEAVQETVQSALGRTDGRNQAKAVLKAMDQLRHQMESSGDYDLTRAATRLDGDYGLSTSAPFTKLTNTSHTDDGDGINTVNTLFKPSTTVTQPANTSGRLLASNCFQCHGTGGVGGFDGIRGSSASEVKEFLTKAPRSNIMAAHAQGYTSAQLDAVIAYLKQ